MLDPVPKNLLSQHMALRSLSLIHCFPSTQKPLQSPSPQEKTPEQRARVAGYLVIPGVGARLEQVCVCQPGSCLWSSWREHSGQAGTPKAAPAWSSGSSSLNEDGIKRARPGGGQEHPATLQRAGTMSRLSAPARAGSWLPSEDRDGKRVAWKRQKNSAHS